jgi:hypothetical protein
MRCVRGEIIKAIVFGCTRIADMNANDFPKPVAETQNTSILEYRAIAAHDCQGHRCFIVRFLITLVNEIFCCSYSGVFSNPTILRWGKMGDQVWYFG